ncbi:hypothetical protein ACEQ6C_39665, partial [Rhizobium ruizarguesonis]
MAAWRAGAWPCPAGSTQPKTTSPIGSFQGELKEATAPELGETAIRAALQRSRVEAEAIEEV